MSENIESTYPSSIYLPAAHVSTLFSSSGIFFFPIDSFICCLWHADIIPRRKTEQKLLPHNLRYFPSMESYFDKQLHQVDVT